MKNTYDYDLIIIGAGSGGVRAGRMAAATGATVAIVEHRALGGTCVNVGCVPKKLFVYAAHFSEEFADATGFGWTTPCSPEFDWAVLRDNKTREIKRLNKIYENLLNEAGVALIQGKGTLKNAHTVCVNNKQYTAKRILLTPGSRAFVPEFTGAEYVVTSDDVFYLEHFPRKIIIAGGGYIAVEFASIFNGLGADTTLSYRRELFLRGFDKDIRHHIHNEMSKKNVRCRFNSNITKIDKKEDGTLVVKWNDGETSEADLVMYATGRIPNTGNLGLNEAGVQVNERGEIIVNSNYQTNIPGIYALGDVTGGMQLTPVALAEAMHFVANTYRGQNKKMDYANIPTAVFSLPNIATVGLTEEQAKNQSINITVYKSGFRHLKHTLSGNPEKTFMKLIVETATDKVLGCHMAGSDAGEIIQGIAIAIKAGATKAIFDQTVGIHPSAAEEFVTMRMPASMD